MNERKRDQKRRDKKGRILRNGESQRADGRYAFVYTDCYGKQNSCIAGNWSRQIPCQSDVDLVSHFEKKKKLS